MKPRYNKLEKISLAAAERALSDANAKSQERYFAVLAIQRIERQAEARAIEAVARSLYGGPRPQRKDFAGEADYREAFARFTNSLDRATNEAILLSATRSPAARGRARKMLRELDRKEGIVSAPSRAPCAVVAATAAPRSAREKSANDGPLTPLHRFLEASAEEKKNAETASRASSEESTEQRKDGD